LDYNSFKKLTASIGGGWNKYDGDHYGQIIWARNAGNIENEHQYYFKAKALKRTSTFTENFTMQFTDKLNAFADLQYRNVSTCIARNG
jgi:iron complex outermembrane receptor protein